MLLLLLLLLFMEVMMTMVMVGVVAVVLVLVMVMMIMGNPGIANGHMHQKADGTNNLQDGLLEVAQWMVASRRLRLPEAWPDPFI
ncbi:hypothetical protein AK812_SmicGene16007 [Symbiodinium microadriaticum]|uniref:Uncharacterized protein n=1 Tax=Symbiodinium microadriaticum TaxID=2951 RepID=A0A1Q9E1I2_SYMMI|nr:hypothetical protein AK812_SmicGene16007 [Symbiodinium microadriaticum]